MKKAYIGIDPGASGGIAVIENNSAVAYKMPDTEADIWELFASLRQMECSIFAVIELVHSMPAQGVKSVFTFGKSYGGLRMALIAAAIPFTEVTPQRWQKDMGCLTKGDKNVSKAKAQQLYPSLKVTHATADSLLIATWALRQAL